MVLPILLLFEQNLPPFRAESATFSSRICHLFEQNPPPFRAESATFSSRICHLFEQNPPPFRAESATFSSRICHLFEQNPPPFRAESATFSSRIRHLFEQNPPPFRAESATFSSRIRHLFEQNPPVPNSLTGSGKHRFYCIVKPRLSGRLLSGFFDIRKKTVDYRLTALCHAYIQYVRSIIEFPSLSGYICGKRTCAVK